MTAQLTDNVVAFPDSIKRPEQDFAIEILRPEIFRLFDERGIPLYQSNLGAWGEREGETLDVGFLAMGDNDVIVVEVVRKLDTAAIQYHLERLGRFKKMFIHYRNHRVFGALAALALTEDAVNMAEESGLFVIAQNGDSAIIRNSAGFHPAEW